jgi:hypothetical protein
MSVLVTLARWEIVVVLGLMLVAVATLSLTGRIHVAGMLRNKTTGALDPTRLQLLVITALSALLMLVSLENMRLAHRVALPTNALLLILGGGHGAYLFQKLRQVRSTALGPSTVAARSESSTSDTAPTEE